MTRARIARLGTISTVALLAVSLVVLAATLPGAAQAQTSGTWSTTGTLNIPRTGHTATLLANGQVLVVGGQNSAGTLITAELYNPATGTWSTTGTTATPRIDHTATLLTNGQVLVAGGFVGFGSNGSEYTATAELYNPSTGKWSTTGSMTKARGNAGAVLLPNGQVLVAGGASTDGSAGASSELYNPATGKWTATGTMPISESAPATLLQSGLVLVAGGDSGEIYNPSTGKWTATPRLYYTDATGNSAAALTNGSGLLYGNHLPSYTGQSYNPVTNTWSRTLGNNYTGVDFGPLVALANGNVLLAGGTVVYNGKSSASARSALYNPATNAWTSTGSLKVGGSHAVVRLQNGKVLAVSGIDAELYTP